MQLADLIQALREHEPADDAPDIRVRVYIEGRYAEITAVAFAQTPDGPCVVIDAEQET